MRPYDERLDQFLSRAAKLFADQGYHSTTMRDLAAATGMSLAGMYYYVRGKEELLYRIQERCFTRVLAGAGAPEADLDDVMQETFIRAFRALGSFRGQCRFRTWLLTIGGNVLKDAHRRAKRARIVPLENELRSPEGDPHDQAVAGEAEARLRDGLRALPRLQREVFLLRAQQGLDYEEIAAALGTTPGAARVHYHHAVKRLKEHVK